MQYISPLTLYVVWHPASEFGMETSKKLFTSFCTNIKAPFDSRLGIPVYFRSVSNANDIPEPIDLYKAKRTVIICMLDENVILDVNFKRYVLDLYKSSIGISAVKFIPVALTKAAFNIDVKLGKLNFLRAYETRGAEGVADPVFKLIYHHLLHEFCKLFLKASQEIGATANPVKLFISHSKHDDVVNDAIAFRDYVNRELQLKTFFDSNDIGFGDEFGKIIEENAGNCVVIAFVSDSYSSREWCRSEIIIAKTNHCPIVLVNAVTTGEARSFPYLGNMRTRRWNGDHKTIVNLALEATLSNFFIKEALEQQVQLFGISHDFVLATYPELFSIIGLKQKLIAANKEAAIIIYPDPPLGNEELRLLNQMDDRFSFVTPLQLSSFLLYE